MTSDVLRILYENWRGEVAWRRIRPIRVWYGSTEWHPSAQWFMLALDLDKDELRDFSLIFIKEIRSG